jgi:hypothetical protein
MSVTPPQKLELGLSLYNKDLERKRGKDALYGELMLPVHFHAGTTFISASLCHSFCGHYDKLLTVAQ